MEEPNYFWYIKYYSIIKSGYAETTFSLCVDDTKESINPRFHQLEEIHRVRHPMKYSLSYILGLYISSVKFLFWVIGGEKK